MLVHSLRDTQSGRSLHLTITALVTRGADPFAAMLGIYLHAKAGDHLASSIGALGFLAREILLEIPRLDQLA
jgi:ADP-dependent NAD(P)H-hydrate dehydratase